MRKLRVQEESYWALIFAKTHEVRIGRETNFLDVVHQLVLAVAHKRLEQILCLAISQELVRILADALNKDIIAGLRIVIIGHCLQKTVILRLPFITQNLVIRVVHEEKV